MNPDLEKAKQACTDLAQFFTSLSSGMFFTAGSMIIPVTISDEVVPAETETK